MKLNNIRSHTVSDVRTKLQYKSVVDECSCMEIGRVTFYGDHDVCLSDMKDQMTNH